MDEINFGINVFLNIKDYIILQLTRETFFIKNFDVNKYKLLELILKNSKVKIIFFFPNKYNY